MQFSDEELIAYLLGDASRDLAERLQRQFLAEPELLERLTQFRILLGQIDSLGVPFEPPADLVDGTLARIDAVEEISPNLPATGEVTYGSTAARLSQSSPNPPVLLSSRGDTAPRRSSIWDSTALTVSLTILCCLALPTLVRVRFESRKAQCARNLSITGSELIQFALNSPDGRFPQVALAGPEAFAGVYAIYLHDIGAKLTPEQLQCASLNGTRDRFPSPVTTASSPSQFASSIPSFTELHRLALDELAQWQRTIGGDYAYNLGVAERGTIRAPKCDGRSQFAIIADAPVITPASGSNSQPGEPIERFIAHEGRGINIFYEDGRVVFVTTASLIRPTAVSLEPASAGLASQGSIGTRTTVDNNMVVAGLIDNPMHNQHGVHEVGLHPQDASLAPSHFAPLGN